MKKHNVVSTKVHIGNQKFISVDAVYDNFEIVQLKYNVYKQYGYTMIPIGNAIIDSNEIEINMSLGKDYGVSNSLYKERVFRHFIPYVGTLMNEQITKIIKGI